MWTSEKFEFEGEFWSMPERTILPKVYQRPHPPMWVAVTSPGTELDAADRGLGSLGLTLGAFVNEQVATVNFLYCHEDDKVGVEKGRHMANTFNYLATQLISTREVY